MEREKDVASKNNIAWISVLQIETKNKIKSKIPNAKIKAILSQQLDQGGGL